VKAERSDSFTCYEGCQMWKFMMEKYCCLVPSPVSSCHLDRRIEIREGGKGDKILGETYYFFKTTQISIVYFLFLRLN
jgi:hypothetical protein